jgi:acyl-CoA reductase-like NAD-dependent aldehyde dehydrogenase
MMDVLVSRSPIDGSLVAERRIASSDMIDRILVDARTAQKAWSKTTIAERAQRCEAIVDSMLAMRDDIVPELSRQMGRPIRYGHGELNGFEERARYMISIAEKSLSPVVIEETDAKQRWISREPIGLLFVIAPWNYPYLTAVNSVIPALMAGNAVLLKHAPQTLLVGERFQQACDAAGLPPGLFTNIVLSHDQADHLLEQGRVDRVHFTGSVASGKIVEAAAGGSFVGVGLELGGKDPAYVREDADVQTAADSLVDGAFFNSGQSCCAVERIYVHHSLFEAFVKSAVALTQAYVLGNPLDTGTTLGPMISTSSADVVRRQIEDACSAGARALIDADTFANNQAGTPYLAPQILIDVDHSMSVMKEESFGPVVGIMSVSDDEDAISLMNDSLYGLTASVWTQDKRAFERIGRELETGTVFMNRCDYLDPALCWTGVKQSGRGVTLSEVGYQCLTQPKSYHARTS